MGQIRLFSEGIHWSTLGNDFRHVEFLVRSFLGWGLILLFDIWIFGNDFVRTFLDVLPRVFEIIYAGECCKGREKNSQNHHQRIRHVGCRRFCRAQNLLVFFFFIDRILTQLRHLFNSISSTAVYCTFILCAITGTYIARRASSPPGCWAQCVWLAPTASTLLPS